MMQIFKFHIFSTFSSSYLILTMCVGLPVVGPTLRDLLTDSACLGSPVTQYCTQIQIFCTWMTRAYYTSKFKFATRKYHKHAIPLSTFFMLDMKKNMHAAQDPHPKSISATYKTSKDLAEPAIVQKHH